MPPSELVSVVVPAYNSARTLDATLRSARGQSHGTLEIIVVDDGSVDDTAAIVEQQAAEDRRVRLIRQANAGVSAARNAGAAAAQGVFIAPLDADDLWADRKIEKQVAIFNDDPELGLVYCWFALIDGDDRILKVATPEEQGWLFERLCAGNIIGNGSSPLIRRSAFDDVGGYDARGQGKLIQGCEDWELYVNIAERHKVGLVREALVGYRQIDGRLSTRPKRMLQAHDRVMRSFLERRPDMSRPALKGRAETLSYLFDQAVQAGRTDEAFFITAQLVRSDPRRAVRAWRRWLSSAASKRSSPAQAEPLVFR
jgi:glycosyltransferase involved in cell wall biosynthesis